MAWLDGVQAPGGICPPLCNVVDYMLAAMIFCVSLYGLLEEKLAEWVRILRER